MLFHVLSFFEVVFCCFFSLGSFALAFLGLLLMIRAFRNIST